jgi:hypothetical protein
MTEEATPTTPAQPAEKPAPRKGVVVSIEQDMLCAEQHIEIWFHDLLASLPHLRETATYNHLRGAIDDLKQRLY